MLRHCWLTSYNPSIDWVRGSIKFHTKATLVSSPSPTPTLSPMPEPEPKPEPEPVHPKLSPADWLKPGKPPRVTLINAKAFAHKSMMQGSQCFHLQVMTSEATCRSATNILGPINLDGVPKEYHDFADVLSKSKAGVLADHHPYDLKITLEDGVSPPPLGPIYSLSQKELLTLHKFIDENTATGFICPSCSPPGAPVLFIWKKDGSLRLCCKPATSGESTGSQKKYWYLLPLMNDLLDALHKAQIYTKIDL